MANVDRIPPILSRLQVVPAGPLSVGPGAPCELAVEGCGSDAGRPDRTSSAVTWQVLDADGRAVPAGGYEAPFGLSGSQVTVVFPTQLHPVAPSVAYLVEATVGLTGPGGTVSTPPTRLRPVTVDVSAIDSETVRALLAHLGHSLVVATAGRGLNVPVPPPPLELLGMPPVPVTVKVEGHDRPDGRPVIHLSARVPTLGTVATGPIP